MDALLPKVIGLLRTRFVPDKAKTPKPPPVPFNVIVLVLPRVALLKVIHNTAGLLIVVPLVLPKAPALVNWTDPPLIRVAPEYVLTPPNAKTSPPVFVKLPVPVIIPL